MAKKTIILPLLSLVIFALMASCQGPKPKDEVIAKPTSQQQAEDAIKSWMLKNNEYQHYKPIVFGEINPRYERTNRTLSLSIQIGEEEVISKETGNKEKLDSLRTLLYKNKSDMLGYIILHKFQGTNLAGETYSIERLFFLDTTFRVATVLTPESFDLILNERVFYRLDSIEYPPGS